MLQNIDIFCQIPSLLDQYEAFISQFNTFITSNNLGVSMNSTDGIMVDCPGHISDSDLEKFKLRIKVLDGVIKQRESQLSDLFSRLNSLKDDESLKEGTLTKKFQELKAKYPF